MTFALAPYNQTRSGLPLTITNKNHNDEKKYELLYISFERIQFDLQFCVKDEDSLNPPFKRKFLMLSITLIDKSNPSNEMKVDPSKWSTASTIFTFLFTHPWFLGR